MPVDGGIDILRVLHGARDIDASQGAPIRAAHAPARSPAPAAPPPAPRSKEPAAALAVTAAAAAQPPIGSASEVAAVNPIERRVVAPPAPERVEAAAATAVTPRQEATGFAARYRK